MTTEGKVSPLPLSKRITPLPWRTDGFYCGYIWSGDKMVADFPMDEDEGTYLARMRGVGRGASRDEQVANAHFIVRAVNAHDRLVAAAEDALSMCRYLQQSPVEERPYGVDIDRVADKCRAAIAAAKEG